MRLFDQLHTEVELKFMERDSVKNWLVQAEPVFQGGVVGLVLLVNVVYVAYGYSQIALPVFVWEKLLLVLLLVCYLLGLSGMLMRQHYRFRAQSNPLSWSTITDCFLTYPAIKRWIGLLLVVTGLAINQMGLLVNFLVPVVYLLPKRRLTTLRLMVFAGLVGVFVVAVVWLSFFAFSSAQVAFWQYLLDVLRPLHELPLQE
jgi:hypothetical protein